MSTRNRIVRGEEVGAERSEWQNRKENAAAQIATVETRSAV